MRRIADIDLEQIIRNAARRCRLRLGVCNTACQAHTRATAILCNELYSGCFERCFKLNCCGLFQRLASFESHNRLS